MPIKHYFDFISSGFGLKEIDEPTGFDAASFNIKQDTGRKGRDVVYAGSGDANFTISPMRNHYFREIISEWGRRGYETEIQYKVDFGNGIVVVGDVDFGEGFETDEVTFANFIVRQRKTEAKYKRNFDANTNLFSDTDIDGNPIQRLYTRDMLLLSKPIQYISEIKVEQGKEIISVGNSTERGFFNPIPIYSGRSEVRDTLSWITAGAFPSPDSNDFSYNVSPQIFKIIRAVENLEDVKVSIDMDVTVIRGNDQGLPAPIQIKGYFRVADEFDMPIQDFGTFMSQGIEFFDSGVVGTTGYPETYNFTGVVDVDLGTVNRTQVVYWCFLHVAANKRQQGRTIFNKMETTITANEIGYNTVVPVIRYIDAIDYATKSASGLEVDASQWRANGEFYNQFITNPTLFRRLFYKPFYLTNKDIIEGNIRTEVNGDYEITNDGKIFLGTWDKFYALELIGTFPDADFEGYQKSINPKYSCNLFNIEFETYASLKENVQGDTADSIHAKAEYKLPNENVENTREARIKFIRDGQSIAEIQRKAYVLSEKTATQDDEKKILLDGVNMPIPPSFTETSTVQHQADGQILTLVNNNSFSWVQLGVSQINTFNILSGANTGLYVATSISDQQLVLVRIVGTPVNIQIENTRYRYTVDPSVTIKARTNEGFSLVENISEPDKTVNMRFSLGRIVRNYYNQELAANMIFRRTQVLRNLLYLNNPDATTQLTTEIAPIREGDNFTPTGAIVTPFIYNLTLLCELSEYWELQNKIRSIRGYILTWDIKGLPLRLYISSGEWTPESIDGTFGKFVITGEEKYEPYYLTIIANSELIKINDETLPSGFSFTLDEVGDLSVFDSTGRLLFPPTPYDRVSVNGSGQASSTEELGMWLAPWAG